MKIIPLIILGLLCSLTIHAQFYSQSIKPKIWLKADKQCDSIGKWNNSISNTLHAKTINNVSLPDTTLFNFHRSFLFKPNNTKLYVNYKPKSSDRLTVITVYKANDKTKEFGLWHLRLDSAKSVSLSTRRIKGTSSVIKYEDTTNTFPIINTLNQSWKNKKIDTAYCKLYIAGTDSLNYEGKFAEFLLFDTTVSKPELAKIHTYLAVKYGITLVESNYINSGDSIIWNTVSDSLFSNDVAAIGKDTLLGINQKQSAACGGDDILTISAGAFANTNNTNTSNIHNLDFLSWGSNALGFQSKITEADTLHYINNLPSQKWLMVRSGSTANAISTSLRFDCSGIDTLSNCYLVINRDANERFANTTTEIFVADSVDTNHRFYFSNIKWDTDGSGRDLFTFMMESSITLLAQTVQPMLDTTGTLGAARFSVFNGVSPFSYALTSTNNYSKYWNSNDSVQFTDNLAPGIYTIQVIDIRGKADKKEFEVLAGNALPAQLFEANTFHPNPVNKNVVALIYPNPTKGEYTLEISFDAKTEFVYRLRDMKGTTLRERKYSGSDSYKIFDSLLVKGNYMIEIESLTEKKSFKLVVN